MELTMPVNKKSARPPHSHPELVDELADELNKNRPAGPGIPSITEEEQTYGNRLHVMVIWDKWAGVDHEERGPIILDAYQRARGEADMLRITLVQGFTIEEYRRRYPSLPGHQDAG
jgi:hypothetical protein